jgi:cell division septation protein DedD
VAAGAATGARWTVQVGTFSRRDFAERMVKQVRVRGFAVVAVGPDERGLYRVRSAAVNTRASAEALRQKMVAQGLKPIVSTAP